LHEKGRQPLETANKDSLSLTVPSGRLSKRDTFY
jgi:hypothetical protein